MPEENLSKTKEKKNLLLLLRTIPFEDLPEAESYGLTETPFVLYPVTLDKYSYITKYNNVYILSLCKELYLKNYQKYPIQICSMCHNPM